MLTSPANRPAAGVPGSVTPADAGADAHAHSRGGGDDDDDDDGDDDSNTNVFSNPLWANPFLQ